MSYSIVINVTDGIVMASDRRLTYQRTEENDGPPVHLNNEFITDSTRKTFKCPNGCGISPSGIFAIDGMNLEAVMEAFIDQNIHEYTDINAIPQMLIDYFRGFVERIDNNIFVAGYEQKDGVFKQKLFYVYLHNLTYVEMDISYPGATWDGERDAISRLILDLYRKDDRGGYEPIPNYTILWRYFTLQDAVDFARFALKTTAQTHRFWSMPEYVSEESDILILKPQDAYWLQKVELQ